jgi:sirohydrochlorin cobaltochelatase
MENTFPDRRIVILAHGSKDKRWQLPFSELLTEMQARLGVDAVRIAYMEFIPPTLANVAQEAASDNKRELLVLPFFLAAGAHLAADIPAQAAKARRRFPRLRIRLLPPIGEHPRIKTLFREIACDYARASLPRHAQEGPLPFFY